MTTEHEASRTLVKSPPELWAECSDATSLARHLDQFGEIQITRLEPETAVAWEGEEVSGTVRLEPSGWGTRVIMTARQETNETEEDEPVPAEEEPPQEPEPQPQPNPLPPAAGTETRKLGLLARMRRWFRSASAAEPETRIELDPPPEPLEPAPPSEPVEPPEPEPVGESPPSPEAALTAALDSLGQAHHRPFSRP
jgi:hypothetical protein